MKSQKGITLISLTIYIIAMVIVVTVVSLISNFMFKNMKTVSKTITPLTEYIRFNSSFSDEINQKGIRILACSDNYIVFSNGAQYTFIEANKGIYKNKAKIARGVTNCLFSEQEDNGKQIVKVQMILGNEEKNMSYTLK